MVDQPDDIYKNRKWSPTLDLPEKVERTVLRKVNPSNFTKINSYSQRLTKILELRAKLLANEPLELIVGTGGRAQSLTFTPEFAETVRNKMVYDLTEDARAVAEEMRELGVAVDLPLLLQPNHGALQ